MTTGAYSVIFGFISNFLFYAFLMTSLTIFTNWKRSTKFHIMVCLGAVYILCGILTYYYGPLENLSIELQMVFMIINLVFCMVSVARTTAFFFNTTKEAHEQLAILASTDYLTGLPNRTSFVYTYEKLQDENETGIGLMMIDTDDFKLFNDTYGHIYGDEILQTVSDVFKSVKQANHYIARYGGEEFTVLVRSNDVNEVYQFAELLRNNVIEIGNSIDKQLSISIGLVYMPLHYMGHPNLISIADELLYQAKSEGKNKIVSKVLGL
ncbi:GGDEF domain-containing protein [Acholeplasma equirhinis]|uniref:GGDEF domain-containing protein n=1 Tax=Acholeplasma equirhinis TaxID=555393 RepID=UPI00197AE6B4|nr:GGDEF domain-containing protein [Acholeplasma equirhinis]MBN3490330.1 GGDEF domain-containing protein [Acholeplasma equirhinis]